MLRIIKLFFFIIFPLAIANSQDLKTNKLKSTGNYYSEHQAFIKPNKTFLIKPDFEFNAIAIKAVTKDFENSFAILGNDTIYFNKNDDYQPNDGFLLSDLIFSSTLVNNFKIFSGNIDGQIIIYLINGLPDQLTTEKITLLKNNFKSNKNQLAFCMDPQSIDQSVWRAGLAPPDYDRVFTEVNHCIIHHAAGSNTDTDYTAVVRSYYILHTETNGWSDIGYNYLIAQDGTIYKGRDPETGEQDNVRGAHFCGKNSNTMGICILGNYMEVEPPEAALNSLGELLSWKLNKDGLDPFGTSYHVDRDLGTIAGHRNGCSTSCPGDYLYNLLGEIRQQVADSMVNCVTGLELISNNTDQILIYPNPTNGNNFNLNINPDFEINEIKMFDIGGKLIINKHINKQNKQINIETKNLKNGIYIIKLMGKNSVLTKKLIIR
ncbi:MAG: N-acetylmuramoyl-L-alanine amidase [Bacteroidota bacterium]